MNARTIPLTADLAGLDATVAEGSEDAYAASTRTSDGERWGRFARWCRLHHLESVPAAPRTVALYLLAHEGTWSASHMQNVVSAIRHAHAFAELTDPATAGPTVPGVLRALIARHGMAPQRADEITPAELRQLLEANDKSNSSEWVKRRTSAMLRISFGGAMRRFDVCNMLTGHVTPEPDRLLWDPDWRKNDQLGELPPVPISVQPDHPDLCPVQAYRDWLEYAKPKPGNLWRADGRTDGLNERRWNSTIKQLAARAGLSGRSSSHSIRVGFVTSALDGGTPLPAVLEVTQHRSRAMAAHYYRKKDVLAGSGHVIGRTNIGGS